MCDGMGEPSTVTEALGQAHVHLALGRLPGASAAEAAWAAARASGPGGLTGPDADAAACDATVVPIVTGHIDPIALDRLAEIYLASRAQAPGAAGQAGGSDGAAGGEIEACGRPGAESQAGNAVRPGDRAGGRPVTGGASHSPAFGPTAADGGLMGADPLSPYTRQRLRRALLALATDALSGPGGLAAHLRGGALRTGPDRDPLTSASLPLDVGPATET